MKALLPPYTAAERSRELCHRSRMLRQRARRACDRSQVLRHQSAQWRMVRRQHVLGAARGVICSAPVNVYEALLSLGA